MGGWEGHIIFNCNRSLSKPTAQLPEHLYQQDKAGSTGARRNISELHFFFFFL